MSIFPQHIVRSPIDGVLEALAVKEGQQVEEGAWLFEMKVRRKRRSCDTAFLYLTEEAKLEYKVVSNVSCPTFRATMEISARFADLERLFSGAYPFGSS